MNIPNQPESLGFTLVSVKRLDEADGFIAQELHRVRLE
jgi:hypothetical protein